LLIHLWSYLGEWGNIKHTFYLFIYSHGIKQPAQEKVVGVNEAQQFLIYIYIKKGLIQNMQLKCWNYLFSLLSQFQLSDTFLNEWFTRIDILQILINITD